MKSLFQYIIEARGIVTGKDDWSRLVDHIVNNFTTDDNYEFHCDRKYLPPWMGDCIVRMEADFGAIAAYADDESALIGDQMDVVVKITEKALKSVSRFKSSLEHELQHAYDDYIGRSRRNKPTFLDDDYCFAIGGEGFNYDDLNIWDIIEKPKACYFDHAFYICRESTYYFAPTEINAYLREFSLYLKSLAIKGGEFDWNRMSKDTKMEGELPLIGMWLTYYMRDHINEYTDIEWDYVMEKINVSWAPTIMGRTYSGRDAKAFVKVIDDIIRKKIRKPMERYIRVIKDSGVKTKNMPEWFK
jgi:hypothetical protein